MNLIEDALQDKLPELAISFFVVFSRFECAMKRIGVYAKGNDMGVDADWERLAANLGNSFFDQISKMEIAQVLIGNPPKKQIKLLDGNLGWRDMGAVENTRDLFLAIRRARNNLIHGGKYQDGGSGTADMVEGAERDHVILSQSMAVLNFVLELLPDLHTCYCKY